MPPTFFSILTKSGPSSSRQSTSSPTIALHGCCLLSAFVAASVSSIQLGFIGAGGEGVADDVCNMVLRGSSISLPGEVEAVELAVNY